MNYICEECRDDVNKLILESEDWSEDEWATILKIFGMKTADRIVISDYKFEAYGERPRQITDEEWKKAIEHLNFFIIEYASIGWAGQFGLNGVFIPLKKRYDNGERTVELYDAIMACE